MPFEFVEECLQSPDAVRTNDDALLDQVERFVHRITFGTGGRLDVNHEFWIVRNDSEGRSGEDVGGLLQRDADSSSCWAASMLIHRSPASRICASAGLFITFTRVLWMPFAVSPSTRSRARRVPLWRMTSSTPQALQRRSFEHRGLRRSFDVGQLCFEEPFCQADRYGEKIHQPFRMLSLGATGHEGDVLGEIRDPIIPLEIEPLFRERPDQVVILRIERRRHLLSLACDRSSEGSPRLRSPAMDAIELVPSHDERCP